MRQCTEGRVIDRYIDWRLVREQFPALANWTFLNTATFGQMPRCAAEAMAYHVTRRDELACADFLSWYDDMDRIRASCARLINCTPADISFVPSASTGLALLVHGLAWKPGEELLTLENEFPNQLYLSAALDRFSARHRVVPWERFYEAISSRTRIVALSTVNYATGLRPPLADIANLLNERGILLYLDGTQSIGALQFDVRQIRPAMVCVDAYKWLLSPNGAGFIYVSPDLRRHLAPVIIGWRSHRNWREVDALHHGEPVFIDTAEKYEGGALPFPSLYAMGAAIDLLLGLGMEAIESRVMELAAKTRELLAELGAQVNTDQTPIITACLPGRDSVKLVQSLKEKRILVSARHGRLRVSAHIYNTEEDLEALRRAILVP